MRVLSLWPAAQAEAWWQRNRVRLRRAERRRALKAIGNSNPPQVVAVIGKAIMSVEEVTRDH